MTMYTTNSFLESANHNLAQLSTSCSPVVSLESGFGSNQVSGARPQGQQLTNQTMMSSPPVDDHNALPSYQSQFPPLNTNGYQTNGTSSHPTPAVMSYGHIANGDANHTASSSPFGSTTYLNGASEASEAPHAPMGLIETTQILTIPVEERRYQDNNNAHAKQQMDACRQAQEEFKVKVELTPHKDRSLSVMIAGRSDQVLKARKLLLSRIQTQAKETIHVSKEFYGAIKGKGSLRQREIEEQTATKLIFPPPGSPDENISIEGTREGIAHAKHKLEIIVAELAKKATEKFCIPKVYHPFISGAFNRQVEQWQGDHGCKVNTPPVSVDSDEIVLSGNRDGVAAVRNEIYKVVADLNKNMGKLDVQIDKAKHKYIIGQRGRGIQEILEKYSVSVEVPQLDSSSNNITLRGQHQNLGKAVSDVYDRAESYKLEKIHCPNWLHRYLIGKDGSKLQEMLGENVSKVHVEFTGDSIIVDGQREVMEVILHRLKSEVDRLVSEKSYEEIKVDSRFHKHVIGKSGANIRQLCQGKQVQIKVPNEMQDSNIIRVEGNREEMVSVMAELRTLVNRVENERSEDVKIEHRLHRLMIGQNGENIRKLRDAYPEVNINFPENKGASNSVVGKSDFVNVRGPKDQVEKCMQQLKKNAKELAENNYELSVSVCKKYHKNIIGREGATINQIRKDANVRIEMPPVQDSGRGGGGMSGGGDSDAIRIIGRRENVEKAKKKILEIESQQANIIERSIDIPFRQHKALIGKAGAHIKAIVNECGSDVTVHFPQDGTNQVQIRGDRKEVEKVVKRLGDEANKICEATEDLQVKQEMHRFLIGREGSYVRKLQEESGGCAILFDNNSEVITLAGSKEAIAKAKKLISARVQQLESTVESEMEIEPRLHRYFMQNNRRVLGQVMDECGGVQISFPPLVSNPTPTNPQSATVKVKGPAEYVTLAKTRLAEIVEDVKNQTWDYIEIEPMHHRTILGKSGSNVQLIENELNVRIKFPDQQGGGGRSQQGDSPIHNAQLNALALAGGSKPPPQQPNQVLVTGRKENVDKAGERLLALVPIEDSVEVPQRFHSTLIGSGGGQLREMQTKHNVRISIPRPSAFGGAAAAANGGEGEGGEEGDWKGADKVIVFGTPENVKSAKEDLEKVVGELVAKSYRVEFPVNPKYFPKIIGPKGSTIAKLRERHGVEIMLPRQNSGSGEDELVAIVGYQDKADKCKEEITNIVSQFEAYETVEINIDTRLHARFIGAKGKNLRKMQDQYKVEIRFPGRGSQEPSKVTITGPADPVDECRDKLLCLAEEYMLEFGDEDIESEYTHPSSRNHMNGKASVNGRHRESTGFMVRDAPWDPANSSDFPALDDSPQGAPRNSWPVRGSRH